MRMRIPPNEVCFVCLLLQGWGINCNVMCEFFTEKILNIKWDGFWWSEYVHVCLCGLAHNAMNKCYIRTYICIQAVMYFCFYVIHLASFPQLNLRQPATVYFLELLFFSLIRFEENKVESPLKLHWLGFRHHLPHTQTLHFIPP